MKDILRIDGNISCKGHLEPKEFRLDFSKLCTDFGYDFDGTIASDKVSIYNTNDELCNMKPNISLDTEFIELTDSDVEQFLDYIKTNKDIFHIPKYYDEKFFERLRWALEVFAMVRTSASIFLDKNIEISIDQKVSILNIIRYRMLGYESNMMLPAMRYAKLHFNEDNFMYINTCSLIYSEENYLKL